MLKKQNRITKKEDFDKIFKKGKSNFTKEFGVKYMDNNLNIVRVGVIVSAKISKKAVDRNFIKRQIKNAINSQLHYIEKGKDIIIITLPEIKTLSYNELCRNIILSFKKLHLFKQ